MAERQKLVFTASRQSHLEGLKALRDKLSKAIDQCESARDLASLSSRHVEVLTQITELEAAARKAAGPETKTRRDEIAERRARRQVG